MSVETNRAAVGGSGQAMQLKLSLRGVIKPPVWRRLLVPADIRLDRLHEVIQTAIGWTEHPPPRLLDTIWRLRNPRSRTGIPQ